MIPKEQFTTITRFSKYLALTLFIGLPFLGFYLGIKYQQSTTISAVCPINPPISQKFDTCLYQDKTANITGNYTDDESGYQLSIPKGWSAKKDTDGKLIIQSADVLIENSGYGLPVRGVEVYVQIKNSRYTDLNELKKELKSGIEGGWIIKPRNTIASGKQAIQYEWGWEGYGTVTTFINNDHEYNFFMHYNPDQTSNQKYLDLYYQLLRSVKLLN